MTDPLDEISRGRQAARLLEDPMLVEAFATVEQTLLAGWRATGDAQERERERLWLMVKLLARLRGHLTEAMETGKMSQRSLDEAAAKRRKQPAGAP